MNAVNFCSRIFDKKLKVKSPDIQMKGASLYTSSLEMGHYFEDSLVVWNCLVAPPSFPLWRNLQLLLLLHPIYPTLSCHTWMNLSHTRGGAEPLPSRSLLNSREKSLNLHPRNHRFMENFTPLHALQTPV